MRVAGASLVLFLNLLSTLLAVSLQPSSFQSDVSTPPFFHSLLLSLLLIYLFFQILESEHAWVVEFYSDMCGSCQEFAPVWETLTRKLKSIKNGKINIDTPEGMKLAQKLGVLDEGIPNIQFYSKKGSAHSLMRGM
jgi:thiol-disulfide isomerase/thioredoxin